MMAFTRVEFFKYLNRVSYLPTPKENEASSDSQSFLRNLKGAKNPRFETFHKIMEINVFDYPWFTNYRGQGFSDNVYNAFVNLWKNKKNNDAFPFLIALIAE